MQTITRFDGAAARILNRLVIKKYYRTKSEAIRAGILELGQKWDISPDDEADLVIRRMQEMDAELKSGKKRAFSIEEVAKQAGVKL